jgi:hypothetical protein
MLTSRTYTIAALAAALTATAIAGWHRSDAEVSKRNLRTERSNTGSPDANAQVIYLPSLFLEEERAAPIEPLPPQF